MLLQFVVGAAACICNIALHALVMLVVVRVAQGAAGSARLVPSLLLITIMVATVSVPMMARPRAPPRDSARSAQRGRALQTTQRPAYS